MTDETLATLQQQTHMRHSIEQSITHLFAAEDEGLQYALTAAKAAGLPPIQISPIQGKFLQLLATMCHARNILEIGSLAGYSGIWLARALPVGGRLLTLEIDPKHADIVRNAFATAGVGDRTEVRVGKALDTLPTLTSEAPFDLVFIDADKPPYPQYLEWALRFTRPGSIIVADNTIRNGDRLRDPAQLTSETEKAVAQYNRNVAQNPRLQSLAFAMDDDYTDGFTVAVVRYEEQ
ncbi:MAG: O-methyltransferase [Ktedonobacteraceae bacterium]